MQASARCAVRKPDSVTVLNIFQAAREAARLRTELRDTRQALDETATVLQNEVDLLKTQMQEKTAALDQSVSLAVCPFYRSTHASYV